MKIALDISPLQTGHKVRGTGFYLQNLKDALLQFYPEKEYVFFKNGEKLQQDIDIVHYPYFEPFFLTLPLIKRYKTVVTVHDLIPLVFPKHFPPGLKGSLKWKIQRIALSNVDAVITDSKSSQDDIARITGIKKAKIHVVYLSAGAQFKKLNITKLQIDKFKKKFSLPDKFLLYVGDATWNKNLPRLIDSIKKTNIPLVIVGEALSENKIHRENVWNKDLLYTQQETRGTKNFIKVGFVSMDDLVLFYNIATAYVFPSLYEGFGLSVLEAMKSGCPVITTKEGSLGEISGDAAYFVDGYNIDSILKGINDVWNDQKLRNNLIIKGNTHVQMFSWEKTAKETMNVYKSL